MKAVRKMRLTAALLSILLGLMFTGCGGIPTKGATIPQRMMRVDFTPFEVETFAPLKRDTIDIAGNCHWRMGGDDLTALLDDMWSRAKPGTVDERVIRLKVTFFGGDDTVVVDQDGGVAWMSRNAQRTLAARDLRELAVEMRRIAKAYGCKHA